jgi:hypothetical protein
MYYDSKDSFFNFLLTGFTLPPHWMPIKHPSQGCFISLPPLLIQTNIPPTGFEDKYHAVYIQ